MRTRARCLRGIYRQRSGVLERGTDKVKPFSRCCGITESAEVSRLATVHYRPFTISSGGIDFPLTGARQTRYRLRRPRPCRECRCINYKWPGLTDASHRKRLPMNDCRDPRGGQGLPVDRFVEERKDDFALGVVCDCLIDPATHYCVGAPGSDFGSWGT